VSVRPKPERVLLIANPVARTVSRPMLDVLEKALAADFKLEVDETQGRGHAVEMARRAVADQFDLMVVFSGDGTVNEAINGLAESDVALGVIPGGATNVLARVLGMPEDPIEATAKLIAACLEGRARTLHLGKANERYFGFNCGIGIDAEAMARVDERRAKSRKEFEWAALTAVVRAALFRYAGKDPHLRVQVDDRPAMDGVSVLIGRTDPYTFFKNFRVRLTPQATLDTGLDVTTVLRFRRRSSPRIVRQVFSGRLIDRKDVEYVHDAAAVEIVGRSPFPVQVDGDFLGTRERLSVRLVRDSLWVFV
jgi:diacylglycerol kinase family enzyme